MPKKTLSHLDALGSWSMLNEFLRDATEADCELLMKEERRGQKRTQYMLRIHARFNKLRGQRERSQLMGG
jgi:hypothetical protein